MGEVSEQGGEFFDAETSSLQDTLQRFGREETLSVHRNCYTGTEVLLIGAVKVDMAPRLVKRCKASPFKCPYSVLT